MKDSIINAPLKGQRNYLHGTDICEHIISRKESFEYLSLTLKRPSRVALCIVTAAESRKDSYGDLYIKESGQTHAYQLVETSFGLNERRQYNEACMTKESKMSSDEDLIIFSLMHGFTVIECIVANHKKLLTNIYGNSDWAFTRIELLENPLKLTGPFMLKLKRKLGQKMFVSEVSSGPKLLGYITFVATKL